MKSENPIDSKLSKPYADGESNDQRSGAKAEVPSVVAKPQAAPTPRDCNVTCNTKRDWIEKGKIVLELVGLGVLIVYTISTIGIWHANRDAVDITRQQVHIGQRAYLYIHNAVLASTPKIGEELQAKFDLTNNGQTPAKDVYYSFNFAISQGVPQAMSPERPISPIPAEQTINLFVWPLNKLTNSDLENITAEMMPSLNLNNLVIPVGPRLYLRVITKYKDVFGGEGRAEFCGIYYASTKRFIGCPDHIDSME